MALPDVRTPHTLTLRTSHAPQRVYALDVRGSGTIDGTATIVLLLHDQPYRSERLSGRIDFKWSGDWYSDTAQIRYEPADVNGGTLTLDYGFAAL